MRKMIAIGLGHAWKEFYADTLHKLEQDGLVQLVGTVDPAVSDPDTGNFGAGPFHVQDITEIPAAFQNRDVIPLILTPDHYSTIEGLAKMGFADIVCEKPLVSRIPEIEKVKALVANHNLKLYAIDFYLPKALGFRVMRGIVQKDDPRYEWITISDPTADFNAMLGDIEGVGVQVIEAGSFCLPDIAGRPYLAEDREIGGMILDLITHTCGPLRQVGLLEKWEVLDASLARLSDIKTGHLVAIKDASREVEMYITALLQANGIPIHLAFGKVPIQNGGLWSLEVRGKKGMYFSGLRTGQPSILLGNDGKVVTFTLAMKTYEFVMREALLYFDGHLGGGFDGNFDAFVEAMAVGQSILRRYENSCR